MISAKSRWSRRTVQCGLFVLVLIVCSLSSQALRLPNAMTVYAEFELTSQVAQETDPVEMVTIATSDGRSLLTLQWQKESSPFGFSMWRLYLHLDPGLVTGGSKLSVEHTPSGPAVLVDRFLPEPGRTYAASLSYHSGTGDVAVTLMDPGAATTRKRIQGTIGASEGALKAQAGQHARVAWTEPVFLPVGVEWELVAGPSEDERLPSIRISQHDVAAVRLRVPYTDPGAQLQLVGELGSERLIWAALDVVQGELLIPLNVPELSAGQWQVGLELVRGDETWVLGQARTIHITRGVVSGVTQSLERISGVVHGSLLLSSDGPIPNVHIQVRADIDRLVHGDRQPFEQDVVLYETIVDIDRDPVVLAFSLGERISADWAHQVALRIVAEEGQEVTMVSRREEHFLPVGESGYMGGIPQIDLAGDTDRLTVIDHIPGTYLGHPDTVLLEDGKTIVLVYPLNHGGPTALRHSNDGGVTWSERLPVPTSWSRTADVPTIFRTVDAEGTKRLIVIQNMAKPGEEARPANAQKTFDTSISLDDGVTWTEFAPTGLNGQVSPNTMVPISGGRYLIVFQLNARIEMAITSDGGLTWHSQRTIASHPDAALTEPAAVKSPDGKEIAVLIRENSRKHNSMLIVSKDEGKTWSAPVELPDTLTGDRHKPVYAPDGRLVITLRDVLEGSPTYGDFVAWVGTFKDLVNLRPGEYRARLLENKRNWWDTGYAGLELLPDGTFVSTTYVPLTYGAVPSVVSMRFTLDELDAMVAEKFEQE